MDTALTRSCFMKDQRSFIYTETKHSYHAPSLPSRNGNFHVIVLIGHGSTTVGYVTHCPELESVHGAEKIQEID